MLSKRWFKKEQILAVHDDNLEEFLSSISLLEDIRNGSCNCSICGASISIDNLGAVYPKGNIFVLICDNYFCITKVLDHQRLACE